ncbi:MAG: hypothetical protein KIT27_02240 [Legionellales bacterium]|nr:hypothetical protein [Legionellales bacterium]
MHRNGTQAQQFLLNFGGLHYNLTSNSDEIDVAVLACRFYYLFPHRCTRFSLPNLDNIEFELHSFWPHVALKVILNNETPVSKAQFRDLMDSAEEIIAKKYSLLNYNCVTAVSTLLANAYALGEYVNNNGDFYSNWINSYDNICSFENFTDEQFVILKDFISTSDNLDQEIVDRINNCTDNASLKKQSFSSKQAKYLKSILKTCKPELADLIAEKNILDFSVIRSSQKGSVANPFDNTNIFLPGQLQKVVVNNVTNPFNSVTDESSQDLDANTLACFYRKYQEKLKIPFMKYFSFWSGSRSLSFQALTRHCLGLNQEAGYSGERTLSVLFEIKWLEKDINENYITTKDAPIEFKNEYALQKKIIDSIVKVRNLKY